MGERPEIFCPHCGARVKVRRDGRIPEHEDYRARCKLAGESASPHAERMALLLAHTAVIIAAEALRFRCAADFEGRERDPLNCSRATYVETVRRRDLAASAYVRALEDYPGREVATARNRVGEQLPQAAEALRDADRAARLDASVAGWLSGSVPWLVLCARVEEVLPLLPDASVDLVEADPPYGTGQWQRPEAGAGADCRAVHRQAEWDVWSPSWLVEALRVSAGPVITMTPMTRLEELLAFARIAKVSSRIFPWVKPDPRPRFSGQPAYGWEPAVCYRSNLLAGGEWDYTIASAPRENRDHEAEGHPHQKPVEVPSRHVRLGSPPGGKVLSLFGGSGSTAEACLREGRRVLVVEADPVWCEKIRARLTRWEERQGGQTSLPLAPAVQLGLPEVAA